MSLFEMKCPECGGDMSTDAAGTALCDGCHHSYLSRFGHLIPTVPHEVIVVEVLPPFVDRP